MANSQEEWLGDGLRPVGVKGGTLPSLRRNFAWTSFGNIVFSGCNWALILVIAKFGTPRMVGQYAIGQAVTGPIIVFAQLQLRYLLVSDSDQSYYRFGDYLGLRMIAITLGMVAVAAITLGGALRGNGRCHPGDGGIRLGRGIERHHLWADAKERADEAHCAVDGV